jgi:hypothetical protein
MTDLNETLAGMIRAEANVADRPGQYDRLNSLADRVSEYESAVQNVLALHKPVDNGRVEPCCNECDDPYADVCVEWPCPTVKALTDALEGGE